MKRFHKNNYKKNRQAVNICKIYNSQRIANLNT